MSNLLMWIFRCCSSEVIRVHPRSFRVHLRFSFVSGFLILPGSVFVRPSAFVGVSRMEYYMKRVLIGCFLLGSSLLATPISSQVGRHLTAADYARAEQFLAQ